MAEKKSMNVSSLIGAGVGALGTIGNWFGIGEKRQDKRQIEQQRKLQELGIQGSKELSDYNYAKQLQMWKDTNYSEQIKEAKDAGMSISALYGGSGGGGAGTISSGGMAIGQGQASDSASAENASTNSKLATAQLANIVAQTEKTKAETANLEPTGKNIEANTANTIWQTELSKKLNTDTYIKDIQDKQNWATEQVKLNFEKENANWEAMKAGGFAGMKYDDENSPIAKAIKAGFEQTVQTLENSKTQGKVMDAEKTIKQFEANLTKQGLPAGSPWYIKIMGDLLGKIGISLTGDTAKAIK